MCPDFYTYAVIASKCGVCPVITSDRSAVCRVESYVLPQECTFSVNILVCQTLFGNATVDRITALIKG